MTMRRSEREVTQCDKIQEIIQSCECCRLGFQDGDGVYIVPLNFAYEETGGDRVFYFHGAAEGRKMDLVRTGPKVGFELDAGYGLKEGSAACSYSYRYGSVIGTGVVSVLEELADREKAMRAIMKHYTGKEDWTFTEGGLKGTGFFKLTVTEMTCKEYK